MTNIIKELQEVISKNIPEIQAEQLKNILIQNEDLKQKLESKQNEIDSLTSRVTEIRKSFDDALERFQAQERNLMDLNSREDLLTEGETKLKEERAQLENEKLQYKLQESEKRADEIKGLVNTVFCNKPFIKTTQRTESSNESCIIDEYHNGTKLKAPKQTNITEVESYGQE